MRLFFAIPLPLPARTHLVALQKHLQCTRWLDLRHVPADLLHVTVKFLGDVPDPDELIAALPTFDLGEPFDLVTEGVAVLPPRGRANVLVANIADGAGTLTNRAAALDDACDPLGLPRERRRFVPHVTLARVHQEMFSAALRSQLGCQDIVNAASRGPVIAVDEIVLTRSDLSTGVSPVYTPMATVPLRRKNL